MKAAEAEEGTILARCAPRGRARTKPHIHFMFDAWFCGDLFTAPWYIDFYSGNTPLEAYNNWKRGEGNAALCPSCNGNDGDTPCAYPSEGKQGCLRASRVEKQTEQRHHRTVLYLDSVPLLLSDIERDVDGGIIQAWVDNGDWVLKLGTNSAFAFSDALQTLVLLHSWHFVKYEEVQVDDKGDYNATIDAADKLKKARERGTT